MHAFFKQPLVVAFAVIFHLAGLSAYAQSNSASISGAVLDPSGAVVAKAIVEIHNPVSHFDRSTSTDSSGRFSFANVPFNPYHLSVAASGFAPYAQDVEIRSSVPLDVKVTLEIAGSSESVTVEAAEDLLENDSTTHTDIGRELFSKIPLESSSSSVSSLVTLASPGIAADSNGLFHGLGDHAENSFSVDGQPITDQQSKVFSNQIPVDSIDSLEVIQGAPPAEYGGKTSLVIVATTRSGQGVTTPHGSVTASYGSFGTSNLSFNLAYGGQKWGNFISANALNSGRFLDPPEFKVMHDKGNEENLFDRVDYQITAADSIHLNFGYSRSWFQNPNTYDQQFHICAAGFFCPAGEAVNPLSGTALGATDQRSKIGTFNIAPSWTHVLNTSTVFTLGAFVRKDQYNYYPSADPFADFSPDLQAQTITQDRRLTNAGIRADISYVKGIHNIKVGATYQHTFLTENDTLGTVDPGFLGLFNQLDASGAPIPGTSCLDPSGNPTGPPCTILAASDLTRGGTPFTFHGHSDVKEAALYAQDTITTGSWSFNLGVRGDLYNAFVSDRQGQPRLGVAYKIKPSSTVLRVSYARSMESPFNENLIIASTGCSNPVVAFLVPPPNIPCVSGPIRPGWRNEFHAGLQQAFGKYLVVDGEYIWKYTHGAYDFGVVAASPIAFPIEWHNSKIPGYTLRASVPNYRGFSALVVMSSVAARFFPPQAGGLPFLPAPAVFRIDHDERFNQTTHLQYQLSKNGPWLGFNWRYDSGLVAGSIPCSAPTATCFASTPIPNGGGAAIPSGQIALVNNITGLPLTADQEFQAGLTCDGKPAAPRPFGVPLATCDAAGLGSIYVKIPAPGKENDDHNPQRIAPRSLFDLSVGDDNLFHQERYKWSLRVTAINLTNKVALYNFFSTFSGTHYVTPRALTAELGFHF
ncbi:MAG: TonB-dependent receptor [Acidobacteriales bacterium]|nr:TonB-dependent receptor [Terriglobales bacterium]